MIVIPDLFGAWQKGREEAIKANWNDLAMFEKIEAARTANDRANLQLLAEQADFNINRNIVKDTGDVSRMSTDLIRAGHAGDLAKAQSNNILQQAQLGVVQGLNDSGQLQEGYGNLAGTWLNNSTTGRANSHLAMNQATDNLAAYLQNAEAIRKALGATVAARAGVQEYNANNALGNAQLAQGQFEASTGAATAAAQNAQAYQQGYSPYASQAGQGAGQVAVSTAQAGVAGNQATVQQLQNPAPASNNVNEQLMYYTSMLSQVDTLLAQDPNNQGLLAQRQVILGAINNLNAGLIPATPVTTTGSLVPAQPVTPPSGGVATNAKGQTVFTKTPAEAARRGTPAQNLAPASVAPVAPKVVATPSGQALIIGNTPPAKPVGVVNPNPSMVETFTNFGKIYSNPLSFF